MPASSSPVPPETDLLPRLELALSTAAAAGDLILRHAREGCLEIETKPDGSIVTAADRAAESLIRRMLLEHYPDDGLLGEEDGEIPGSSGYRWVIDPIDGTTSFVHGVPLYGCLVGVELETVPVAGVLHLPALDTTTWGARGKGAWFRAGSSSPCPARVSETLNLAEAMVCATSMHAFQHADCEEAYGALVSACRDSRGWSDCFGYHLLTCGRVDVFVDADVKRWDISPLVPILEESGGQLSTWSGASNLDHPRIVGSNGHLHAEILSLLAPYDG